MLLQSSNAMSYFVAIVGVVLSLLYLFTRDYKWIPATFKLLKLVYHMKILKQQFKLVPDFVEDLAKKHPDRVQITDAESGEEYTLGYIDDLANRVARTLHFVQKDSQEDLFCQEVWSLSWSTDIHIPLTNL